MKAVIDREACICCQGCLETCPEVFGMDEDKAFVFDGPIPKNSEKSCRGAVNQCPINAIKLEEL
ncbi:MAG: ferredoxin [Candidatus Aureabacteria bacterium]|nr:ferredoxin [Candidatus Auribacterota bacterium]